MRILVVDDNAEALLVVERFLKALDHQVFAYTEGMEALLWLKEAKPQVAVVDLEMPGMDGFDFLKRLRCYQAHVNTPAICITGTDTPDEEILRAGFSSILRKPTTLSEMMEAVDNAAALLSDKPQQATPPVSEPAEPPQIQPEPVAPAIELLIPEPPKPAE